MSDRSVMVAGGGGSTHKLRTNLHLEFHTNSSYCRRDEDMKLRAGFRIELFLCVAFRHLPL